MHQLEQKIDNLTEIMASVLAGIQGLMVPLESMQETLAQLAEPSDNDAMEKIMDDLAHIKKAVAAVPEKVVTAMQTGELDRVC